MPEPEPEPLELLEEPLEAVVEPLELELVGEAGETAVEVQSAARRAGEAETPKTAMAAMMAVVNCILIVEVDGGR